MPDPSDSLSYERVGSPLEDEVRPTRPFSDLLDSILSDEDLYRHFLSNRGQDAQRLLDALQEVCPHVFHSP